MNIKNALAGFLKEEPRRSGRLEAIRFMRRYATRNRPMTHYRLQGPAVDAVPLLLRKAGLEDGRDFKVEKSAASDRTAKLWWLDGANVASFMLACSGESAVEPDGLSPFDRAYAAVLCGESDEIIAGTVRDATVGVDVAAAPAAASAGPATTSGMVRAQSEAIRRAIVTAVENGLHSGVSPNAKEFGEEFRRIALAESEIGVFVPSLSDIEFYVRVCKGKTLRNGPDDLVFAPYSGLHTVARSFGFGDNVPIGRLLDAPLFITLDGNGNPMVGYVSARADDVVKCPADKVGVVLVANAPLVIGVQSAANQVAAASFAMIRRRDFWEYVTWLYREAFPGFGVELTRYHSVGHYNLGKSYADFFVAGSGEDPMVSHVGRCSPDLLSAVAMFAVVIAPRVRRGPFDVFSYPNVNVNVVSGAPDRPDLSGVRITDDELPSEWYAITHVGGSVLDKDETWYRFQYGDADRQAQLNSFREWSEDTFSVPQDVGNLCSVANNPYLQADVGPDSASFSTMSSLLSGIIAAVKHWYGESERVPLRDWGGEDLRGCHTKGSLVSAVYSGLWSNGSRTNLGEYSDGSGFPMVRGYAMDELVTNGSFIRDARDEFTKLVDRLSNRDTDEQSALPPTVDSVRCSLIVETNVDSAEFSRRASADPEAAVVLARKLQFLFVSSVLFRKDDPFGVLNGDDIPVPESAYHEIASQLARDNVPNGTQPFGFMRKNAASLADSCVKVEFRDDSFGRVYAVFTLGGAGADVARYMFRHHAGLPVPGCSEAEKAFRSADDENVVYVCDWTSRESADELIRKVLRRTGTSGNVCGVGSRDIPPGASRPLVCASLAGVPDHGSPSRSWFSDANAMAYVPSQDVGMY